MSTNDVSRAAVQHTFDLILAGGDLLEFAATDPVVASMRLVEVDEVLRLLGEYIQREKAEMGAIEMLMIKRSWDFDDAAEGQNLMTRGRPDDLPPPAPPARSLGA